MWPHLLFVEVQEDMAVSVMKGPHDLAEDSRGCLGRLSALLSRLEVASDDHSNDHLLCCFSQLGTAHHVHVFRVTFTDMHNVAATEVLS